MVRGTIREERPDLLKYLVNEEDGELTCGSGKKIKVRCPQCNRIRETIIDNLNKRGFSCNNIHCSLCKNSKEYLYDINEIINGLKIIKQIRNSGYKKYIVQCTKDKYKYEVTERSLKLGIGCPVCGNRKIIIGINDISTTHPNIVKYLKNKEDGFKYSAGNGEKIKTICPECKSEKKMTINKLIQRGFSCDNKECKYHYTIKANNTYQKTKIKNGNFLNITHPHLIKYLKNKEDGFKSKGTKEKIIVVCPICKTEQTVITHNLTRLGFSCQACGDGNSYPNKFMECLVRQSGIEFFTEQQFDWATNEETYKIYDIYIPSLKCIIENHGGQHYIENGFFTKEGRSFKEERKNDKLKRKLANENNIKYYFEIDCRKSELNWIKKSVINSGVLQLLNLNENDINWLKCHKYAIKSKVNTTCDLWNKGYSVKEISNELSVRKITVWNYLKQGKDLGLCDNYNKQESQSRGHKNHSGKKVFIDNRIFNSVSKCSRFYNENQSTVSRWLRGVHPMPQKYIDLGLRYYNPEVDGDIEQYEQYIETKAI